MADEASRGGGGSRSRGVTTSEERTVVCEAERRGRVVAGWWRYACTGVGVAVMAAAVVMASGGRNASAGIAPSGDEASRPTCKPGEFRVGNMTSCHRHLTCSDLAEVRVGELVGQGSTKSVYRAQWRGHDVTVAALAEPSLREDFHHGLDMLLALGPSRHVVQLVGYCRETDVMVTEYHPRGDARRAAADVAAAGADGVRLALALCRSLAEVLAFLHDSPAGRRVMCDSNDVEKALSQFVVAAGRDNATRLVVVDLDALPDAAAGPVRCGRRPPEGDLVAPEQRWQHGSPPSGHDEKIDVWKLAGLCEHFLSAGTSGNQVLLELQPIHERCRHRDSEKRPSVKQVIAEYGRMMEGLRT